MVGSISTSASLLSPRALSGSTVAKLPDSPMPRTISLCSQRRSVSDAPANCTGDTAAANWPR
jgi:hypothetical protein